MKARWWQFWRVKELARKIDGLEKTNAMLAKMAEDYRLAGWAIAEYAPKPTCRICGSTDLVPDPAGYYYHARRWDGAPLCCLTHPEKLDKEEQGSGYGTTFPAYLK